MADPTKQDDAIDSGADAATEPGTFGQRDAAGQPGGINQGTEPALTPEQAAVQRQRMSQGDLVDDNAASHQGGMGAQGGAADFGSQGNLAGGLPGVGS